MSEPTVDRETVLNMAVRSQMQKTQKSQMQKTRVVPMVSFAGDMSSSSSPVVPMTPKEGGFLSISALNPDLNEDGQVEPWEREVYQKLLTADTDGSGTVTAKELFGVLRKASEELREARQRGGIPISDLNPDADGDGRVEAWENDVFLRIQDADEDRSGTISVKELFGVIRRAAESDRQKRLFRKLLVIACLGFVVMLCANMALTAAVVFLAKDTVVSADGALTTPAGEMVRVRCVAES